VECDDLHIRSTGVRLPTFRTVEEAVAGGDCPPRIATATRLDSVAVSPDESAAELAAAAAEVALERAGTGPGDLCALLHADVYHQGRELWPVASYVQRAIGGGSCPAVEIRQMSNGGLAALDLAAAYLQAGRGSEALITTGDRFAPPGMDRWRSDPGTVYADGGTALVLSRRHGVARVRSLAVLSDPELEPMHRGDEPFSDAPFSDRATIDMDAAKRVYIRQAGMAYAVSRAHRGQEAVLKQALAEADLDLAEAEWVLLPHFGHRRLDAVYYQPFGIDPARTAWDFSRTVGHLGAGDQIAALDHLVTTGRAAPGDRCVLISVGAGYSWGCAVLEITGQAA
jgi:3-oxoacyl-[acyl-carrier-protein] synthase III